MIVYFENIVMEYLLGIEIIFKNMFFNNEYINYYVFLVVKIVGF